MEKFGTKYEFEGYEDFLNEVLKSLPMDKYGRPKCVWKFNNKTRQMEGYVNCPCVLDTETTNYITEDIKTGWPYQWMFGVDGIDIKGSDIDEFLFVANALKEELKLNAKHRMPLYIQNLQFDISFLLHKLQDIAPIEDYFIIDNRKFLYLRWNGYEFRCQFLLTGESLDTQGKNLTDPHWKGIIVKQVGKLDYNKVRLPQYSDHLTDDENLYCWMDIDVQQAKLQELLNSGEDMAHIPYTAIGFVRRTLKERVLSNKQLARRIQSITMELDEFESWEKFASGGFTHGNAMYSEITLTETKENEGINSNDICSSYPTSCMAFNNYPMSTGRKVYLNTLEEVYELGKRGLVLFHIVLNNLKLKPNVYEPILSHKKGEILEGAVKDNGKIRRAKRISFWTTSDHFGDIDLFYSYDKSSVGIGNAWFYITDYLPKEYFDTILELYQKKTLLKDKDGYDENGVAYSITYQNSKRDINGIFGDTYMNPIRDAWGLVDDDWDDIHHLTNCEKQEALTKYNENTKRYNVYMWGAMIAANSRSNLFKAIYELGKDFIYSDTDSVKYFHYSKHKAFFEDYDRWITYKLETALKHYDLDVELLRPLNKPLGLFEWEFKASKFKFLHSKCYIYTISEHPNPKKVGFHCTVAGIKKKDIKEYLETNYEDPYEAFNVGLVIDAEYSNKLCRHYAKRGYELEVADYEGRVGKVTTYKDAICLEPIPFAIQLQDEYEVLLDWLQKRKKG